MNSYCMAGQMIARAPAPQILGYWVQFLPPDLSVAMDPEIANEISEALAFVSDLQNAHRADPVSEPLGPEDGSR